MTVNSSNQANATTTRNQSGQFAPSDEQTAKAEELAKQRNSVRRLERLQALYATYLNHDPDSDLATQIDTGRFYMTKTQCHAYYKSEMRRPRAPAVEDPASHNFINCAE